MATTAVTVTVSNEQITLFKTGNSYVLSLADPSVPLTVGTRVVLSGSAAVGPIGPQGPQGAQGAASTVAGPQGAAGAQGDQGPQGVAGPQGVQGSQGAQGATGPQGAQGDTGAKGDTGSQGIPGVQGPTGPTGPQGVTGSIGLQGDQGPAGTITVESTLTGAAGSQASVVNIGSASQASLRFTIPQGAQGAQGTQGPQGGTGAQGSQGAQGVTGPQGATGPAVALSDANPQALGAVAAGTGAQASRSDHVHPTTGLAVLGSANAFTAANTFGAQGAARAFTVTSDTSNTFRILGPEPGEIFSVNRAGSYFVALNRDGGRTLIGVNAADYGGRLNVTSGGSTFIGLVVRGAASQTANLQEWQNSAGTVLASVDSSGFINSDRFRTSPNTYGVFRERNNGAELTLHRATAATTNPGANLGTLYFRDGTNAGTLKLVVRAGTGGGESTLFDNIQTTGSGSTVTIDGGSA